MIHTRSSLVLLACAGLGLLPASGGEASEAGSKAPFHVLYDNDLTNIVTAWSPYNPHGGAFEEPMLRAAVDEVAGTAVDAQMLQPGLGWVPWWRSTVQPMADHLKFLERTGRKPDSYETYVAAGGDVVKVFVEECRAKGMAPFISLRMNDAHHIFRANSDPDPSRRAADRAEFQFFADHPEYMLGDAAPNPTYAYLFDWAHPEVRQYKLALLKELCANYDLAGVELDFMRHPILFSSRTPPETRRAIMAEFIGQVRSALDSTSAGRHRWLCVRIPGYVADLDPLGIDLKAWAAAGVDMVNVSGYYFTDPQMEIAEIRRQLPPNVAVYDEMHFVSAFKLAGDTASLLRRTTDQEFYTTAHLAYARGADGVSLFNFQYYRGTPKNAKDVAGTATEPPFQVLKKLGDPAWLARQPQDYFSGTAWEKGYRPGRLLGVKRPYTAGTENTVVIDMAPPAGGWKKDGRLRIQGAESLAGRTWKVSLDGTALAPVDDVSFPYSNPYDVAVGAPDDYRAWTVPAGILKDGENRISISLQSGEPAVIFYCDVLMP